MLENPKSEDGELDLRELLAAIWSHKILIALLTSLSIFFFGYIALTADKEYTAFAIFEVSETNANSGFSLPSELGTLASLAGLSAGTFIVKVIRSSDMMEIGMTKLVVQ